MASPSIEILSRARPPGPDVDVARPRFRWRTRVFIPAVILLSVCGLLAYSARSALTPATPVWTVPVVPKPVAGGTGQPTRATEAVDTPAARSVLAQAPGWIEPDPYAISVPALAEGVIKEVLVLEGQPVEAGQAVARMIDEDARLALQAAEADLAALKAQVTKAEADLEVAQWHAAEADYELERLRGLAPSGAVAAGELARQEFQTNAARQQIESAKAAIGIAKANVQRQQVACDEAGLLLSRMEIVSPVSGVVLTRSVEPGIRIEMNGAGGGEAHMPGVLRVYDPSHLQVRVDVPLADSAKIGAGALAEIVTEALPDEVFHGRVTRIVHEADIQRNTVQVKVAIDNPRETLKPEMLVRVRFYSPPAAATGAMTRPASTSPSLAQGFRLLIPESALLGAADDDKAQVWVVEHDDDGEPTAALRDIAIAGREAGGHLIVGGGLRPGDRLIIDPPRDLREGARVRVLGEAVRASNRKEQRP